MTTDVVHSDTVCRKNVNSTTSADLKINRAGAVAEYVAGEKSKDNGMVVVCGGRNGDGQVVGDCVSYTPRTMVSPQCESSTNN